MSGSNWFAPAPSRHVAVFIAYCSGTLSIIGGTIRDHRVPTAATLQRWQGNGSERIEDTAACLLRRHKTVILGRILNRSERSLAASSSAAASAATVSVLCN